MKKVFFDTFFEVVRAAATFSTGKTSVLVLAYFVRRNRKSGITLAE
ncbi:TPA: hypothetical protein ACIEI9_001821 [Streptococcus pyogenes]